MLMYSDRGKLKEVILQSIVFGFNEGVFTKDANICIKFI